MATWITPKTDWVKTDSFTYTDYNRIKNNLTYLNDLFNSLAPEKAVEFDFGEDYTYANNYDVDIFNMFEECLQSFTRIGSDVNIGEFKVHRGNSQFLDYDDLNRIEKCCVNWYSKRPSVKGVTVYPTSISFTVKGTTEQLVATVYPESAQTKTVTWSSSDDSIAIVDSNGLVTPKGNGNAIITCTTVDGGFTATCSVEVDIISVTSVTLVANPTEVYQGNSFTLQGSYLPSDASFADVTLNALSASRYFDIVSADEQNLLWTIYAKQIASIGIKFNLSIDDVTSNTVNIPVLDPTKISKMEQVGTFVFDDVNYIASLNYKVYPANIRPAYLKTNYSGSVTITVENTANYNDYSTYKVSAKFPKPHLNSLCHVYLGNSPVTQSTSLVDFGLNPYIHWDS